MIIFEENGDHYCTYIPQKFTQMKQFLQIMLTEIPIPCLSPFQLKKYWCYVAILQIQIEQIT
jgi:hypothetical protein